jgi:hypothetical protein
VPVSGPTDSPTLSPDAIGSTPSSAAATRDSRLRRPKYPSCVIDTREWPSCSARGEQDDQQAATAVDRGVDLRALPAARPAECMIAQFAPAAARIPVIQPSPYGSSCRARSSRTTRSASADAPARSRNRPTPTNRPGQQRRPRTGSLAAASPRSRRNDDAASTPSATRRTAREDHATHPDAITENGPLDHLAMITLRTRPPARGINGSIRADAVSLSSAERVPHPDSRDHQHRLGRDA